LTCLELHTERVLWYDELLVRSSPIFDGGYIEVPTSPGLGFELNMPEAEKHLKPGEKPFD